MKTLNLTITLSILLFFSCSRDGRREVGNNEIISKDFITECVKTVAEQDTENLMSYQEKLAYCNCISTKIKEFDGSKQSKEAILKKAEECE